MGLVWVYLLCTLDRQRYNNFLSLKAFLTTCVFTKSQMVCVLVLFALSSLGLFLQPIVLLSNMSEVHHGGSR